MTIEYSSHTHSLAVGGIITHYDGLTQIARNVAQEVAAERAAERQRQLIVDLYAAYDESWGEYTAGHGEVVRWERTVSDGRTYSYAALYVGKNDGRWYLTGGKSPQGLTTDKLVDLLVEQGVNPDDVETLS